jgi:hemoglobin
LDLFNVVVTGRPEEVARVEQQRLYERLGGVNAIAMVVDRFSDAIIVNPKLQEDPALREWNESGQLAGLKFMRTLWLCQEAGGPFQYTGKELREAHKDLHITSDEFDEVGAEIARALDHLNVPEREKQEVLAAIVARKDAVVNPSP